MNDLARRGKERTRAAAVWAVQQRWFDGTILTLIVLGTILLAVDSARLEKDVLLGEPTAVVLAKVLYYINPNPTTSNPNPTTSNPNPNPKPNPNPNPNPNPKPNQVLYYINIVFTGIFIIEMLVKMAAFSCCGYFHDGWNWLDFFIVLVSPNLALT